MSRDPKFGSSEQVPFMEEWKARRERMRLRSSSSCLFGSRSIDIQVQQETDLQTQARSSHVGQAHNRDTGEIKATTTTSIKIQSMMAADVEAHEPVISKTKEKSGTPQKKHRTQIEKRKLREKRRPTGVVNMFPAAEDPDEIEDVKENDEHKEQDLALLDEKAAEDTFANRPDGYSLGPLPDKQDNSLKERQLWMEELQKEVSGKRQDNVMLTTQLNDKEGSVLQLQTEMKSLTQKMTRAQDENKRLKDENQMLLKMMGQLSS